MRNIRLFNLALLLVAVLFVQDSRGQSTVEHATTDANGWAEAILTLGPIPGTNTFGVSTGHESVTFNAVGGGTPDTPSSMDSEYRTWHLPDGVIARLGKGGLGESDRNVAFSPDGQRLAVASGMACGCTMWRRPVNSR